MHFKENAFEPSTSVRHACELNKALNADGKKNPVECHYHDGGPDHNLHFPRTQLTQIAYFIERDLDLLILVQTPPHHSWKNPAERIMSNLNLALQGIGVMRAPTATMELQLRSTQSLKAIREAAKKNPTLKEEVNDSIQPTKTLINSVFQRLQLKGKNFQVFNAASREEIVELAIQLKKIDHNFDPEILLSSSKPCKPSEKLKDFMETHCVMGHYQFSIKRCSDKECVCGSARTSPEVFSQLRHLPFPVPQRDKYLHFEDLYGKENVYDEKHVPSKLQAASKRHSMPFPPSSQQAKNVKMVVQCEECLKWRVCYTARVLTRDQKLKLERELELLSYTCGACFQDIEDLEDSVFNVVYVNDKLTCETPIEAPYYVTFNDPLCFYCGSEHNLTIQENHYPLCNECSQQKKIPKKRNTRAYKPK